MMGLLQGVKIHLCTQPTDMRRGFDGLSGMVVAVLEQDPLSGHLFVFRNRNRDKLKILYWDTDGLAIWYKKHESLSFLGAFEERAFAFFFRISGVFSWPSCGIERFSEIKRLVTFW
jgi:hypothetical protein